MAPLRILTSSDVDSILTTLSPQTALASQASVFTSFSQTSSSSPSSDIPSIQTPHRITIASEGTTTLFMPSRAPTSTTENTTACKIVAVPNGGGGEGLPASTIIMDESSGRVKALINARKLTALRNAAGSALFLSLFPTPQPPTHLLVFGTGAQALAHATLFLRLHPSIMNLTFIIRSSTPRASSLLSHLQSSFPQINIALSVHSDASSSGLNELVNQADIIVTTTSSTSPLFNSTSTSPKKGTRVILIGSYKPTMHEVDTALIKRSGIVVDSREACAREAGELIDAQLKERDMVELGEVLSETEAMKKRVLEKSGGEEGVIVFKSVGLGIQDVSIARLVLDEAEQRGIGTIIDDYD
ncbi:hypothetical protein CI109_106867 [Kwoniella shandongensis]|uniref:Uncharacterized protein n=1 Tax=Kwoniella shandongensis TaxID=1734106 RepID=A0A5M6C6E0_9TREE|nr:uncharacterized protein CI109_000877 [Kwoniella shandongensis]KAA5530697.1 hypothetical protein CI109_000877 [Kwoniella shandongensis]